MPDDLTPFFAGTYFPPQPRQSMPSFEQVLRSVHAAYHDQREAIQEQNRSMQQALEQLNQAQASDLPGESLLYEACSQLERYFDAQNGGIGSAPKFPHPSTLDFLLRHGTLRDDAKARHMALFTLERMAEGGINDQLGGGFCRYAVDAQWMIPHFEKMLYDNGPLLALYADAWQADAQRPLFRHVCERTAQWVMREMQSPQGGYYSSLDADSEGEEGRFYVWNRKEVAEHLDDTEYTLFAERYGLERPPNFEGCWHLHVFTDTGTLARRYGLDPREVRRHLKSARDKLFALRERRIRPGRDEKIPSSWNALMIRGMARAGRMLQQPDWVVSAEQALTYLRTRHWREGRLLASSRDGQAALDAYLDDHVYLIDAILELLQARWSDEDLGFAIQLAEVLLAHFQDNESGGFYFTADDHEQLPVRMRPFSDDAMPSGNAIAAFALQRLGCLLSEPRYLAAAENTLEAAAGELQQSPYNCTGLLTALQEWQSPPETLIIRGTGDLLAHWQARANTGYRPGRQAFAIPGDARLPQSLADKTMPSEGCIAYRCVGTQCLAPIRDLGDIPEKE